MDTKTLCLGILNLQDASGYDIKNRFEAAFSHYQGVSFGSINPALTQLTEQGLATYREEQQPKHPAKKIFQVTDAGREAFLATLSQTQPTEKFRSDFLVLLMFAHLYPTERLAEILDRQMANLETELEYLHSIEHRDDLTAGMRFTVEYGIAAKQARLDVLRQRREPLLHAHRQEQEPSS